MNDSDGIQSEAEAKLWSELRAAWNEEKVACHHEIAKQYTSRYPNNSAGWVALADVLTGLAKYNSAHRALTRAERLAPASKRGSIFLQWGHYYKVKSDLESAEKAYRDAAKFRPDTLTFTYLGTVLSELGRFTEALGCYSKAIKLGTHPVDEVHLNIAYIMRANRKYSEALSHLDEAIKIDPNYSLAKTARTDIQDVIRLVKKMRNKKSK